MVELADGLSRMIELVDRWILPLEGRVVVETLLEYTVLLQFDDMSRLIIEAPLVLRVDDQALLIDPEGDVGELVVRRPFENAVVTEAVAFKTGTLRLVLADRTVVEVAALEDYESWTLFVKNGPLIVCRPGGELSTWDAIEN